MRKARLFLMIFILCMLCGCKKEEPNEKVETYTYQDAALADKGTLLKTEQDAEYQTLYFEGVFADLPNAETVDIYAYDLDGLQLEKEDIILDINEETLSLAIAEGQKIDYIYIEEIYGEWDLVIDKILSNQFVYQMRMRDAKGMDVFFGDEEYFLENERTEFIAGLSILKRELMCDWMYEDNLISFVKGNEDVLYYMENDTAYEIADLSFQNQLDRSYRIDEKSTVEIELQIYCEDEGTKEVQLLMRNGIIETSGVEMNCVGYFEKSK